MHTYLNDNSGLRDYLSYALFCWPSSAHSDQESFSLSSSSLFFALRSFSSSSVTAQDSFFPREITNLCEKQDSLKISRQSAVGEFTPLDSVTENIGVVAVVRF